MTRDEHKASFATEIAKFRLQLERLKQPGSKPFFGYYPHVYTEIVYELFCVARGIEPVPHPPYAELMAKLTT